jgi:hypothetical protein
MRFIGVLVPNVLLGMVATGGLAGCGASNPDEANEAPGVFEQAWASGPCASATANATFSGGISPAKISPQSYNTCTKSYVVDVTNLNSIYTGPGSGPSLDAHIQVDWGDTDPLNQADCEDMEGGAIFYKRVNNQWVDQTGQVYDTGQWISGGGGGISFCNMPRASFYGVQAGSSYRIAATMRRISSGNPTRKVRIATLRPQFID